VKQKRICRPWVDEEIEYLRESFGMTPFEEMEKHLNRSACAIRLKANGLGFTREIREYNKWSREDTAYLEENYGYIDSEIIAKKLNKSIYAVRQKANKLEIYKDRVEGERPIGVKLKCTYIDRGQKKSRNIYYPTERSEKKASERAINCLIKMMKYQDVKVVEVRRL